MLKIERYEKILKILLIILICLLTCFISIVIFYNVFRPNKIAENLKDIQPTENTQLAAVNNTKESPLAEGKIGPSTKMVYEYYYTLDGTTETAEETAPYFLINMDKQKVKDIFLGWKIVEFTPEKVIMRKELNEKSVQHYIIKEQDGFLTVFYEKPINGSFLKEITNTPIESLPVEEQERLAQGIKVSGEEELMKVLEDYGS